VDDCEAEVCKEKGPVGLMVHEFLFRGKIDQIPMVGPNLQDIITSFQVMAEGFKGADDGKEFFIMDLEGF
jgi:hypothetical protein